MTLHALLLTLPMLLAAAGGGDAPWIAEVIMETPSGMGGATIGDLDPHTPGNEVFAVNGAGEVWMARRTGDRWKPERIHHGKGEMIMCAVGDIDPRYPGNEFVGVGMVEGQESRSGPGQATMVRREGDGWTSTPIFIDDHMLHGVAIGDVSARYPGTEVLVCGFNHRVTLLHLNDGTWRSETVYVGNDRLKVMAVADILPERDGLEVVVCGSDGNAVLLWEGELGWNHQVIFSNPIGQSRVAAGKSVVLIGGDDGQITRARRANGHWTTDFLHRDTGKIRGVAIADIDPAAPGPEYYAGGYSTRIWQFIQNQNGFWHAKPIFTAKRPLHHLVAGDIDPDHEGNELITCGHGGKLYLLTTER